MAERAGTVTAAGLYAEVLEMLGACEQAALASADAVGISATHVACWRARAAECRNVREKVVALLDRRLEPPGVRVEVRARDVPEEELERLLGYSP